MRIRIMIDKDSALKAGKDEHGLKIVNVPAGDFHTAERETLIRHGDRPLNDKGPEADYYLDDPQFSPSGPNGTGHSDHWKQVRAIEEVATEPTATAVHLIIGAIADTSRQNAAARAAEEKAQEAKHEAEIAELLTQGPEAFIDDRYQAWSLTHQAALLDDDPRFSVPIAQAAAIVKAHNDAREAKEEATRAEKKAAAAAEETAKADWIAAHGSDYLKRAHGKGYDCQRKYVTERAAIEYPDYVLDFGDVAEWKDRSCPSLAALDLIDAAPEGAAIVWLTHPTYGLIDEEDEPIDWTACEAIVIRGYLTKYDLVREL